MKPPLHRLIKKSLYTWWLQYNRQVHKDFWSPCIMLPSFMLCTSLLTDSTEHDTPWESNGCASSIELPRILRLQKAYNCSTNKLPLVTILRQIQSKFWNPIIFNTNFNIIFRLCLGFSRGFFLSGNQSNSLFAFHFPDTCAKYPPHHKINS
jgi:hypothetical protein